MTKKCNQRAAQPVLSDAQKSQQNAPEFLVLFDKIYDLKSFSTAIKGTLYI